MKRLFDRLIFWTIVLYYLWGATTAGVLLGCATRQ